MPQGATQTNVAEFVREEPVIHKSRLSVCKALAIVGLVFVASRILFYRLALSYWGYNQSYLQMLDPEMLTKHLLQSLFYLHSQPPAMNLLAGLALKWFPLSHPAAMSWLWKLMGLLSAEAMLVLMCDLALPVWLALLTTLVFTLSPESVLYENWFYATYPSISFLVLAAASLARFLRTGRFGWGLAFLLLLALLVVFNSSFQLLWFVAALVLLNWTAPEAMAPLRRASIIVGLLIVSLYLKNWMIVGSFSTSSWFGMNLASMATAHDEFFDRQHLISQGTLSPSAVIVPFSKLSDYGPSAAVGFTGIRALDTATKADGSVNFNNLAYVKIAQVYGHDARWMLLHRPGVYLASIGRTFVNHLQPASDYGILDTNRGQIVWWNWLYDSVLLVRRTGEVQISLVFLVGFPLLWGLSLAWLWRRYKADTVFGSVELTVLFMTMTIMYVTAVAVFFNYTENDRLRAPVDPYYLVLAAFFGWRLARFFREGRDPS
jgi:hypothetical protein